MMRGATWFDGDRPAGQPVRLDCSVPGEVRWATDGGERRASCRDAQVTGALAQVPRFVWLGDGGRLEIPWDSGADAFWASWEQAPRPLARAERWLGERWRLAAGAVAVLVLIGSLAIAKGVPAAARHLAFAAPPEVEKLVGAGAMRMIRTSTPPVDDAARVRQQLARLTAVRHLHVKLSVRFVRLGQPNAFALPGGTIVVTSELMNIGLSDDQIAAVLAHELGHEELRHGMRQLLQGSAALLAVALVTGDLSTLTSLSGSLPFTLISRGYSRDFEREADEYAVGLMRDAGINPESLATALQRLAEASGQKSAATQIGGGYLSTHPSNAERIQAIRAAAKQ